MKLNVVDIESTCWEHKHPGQRSEMIQIGICEVDTLKKTISSPVSIYIIPEFCDFQLSEFCTNLTGITMETLEEHGVPRIEAFDLLRKEFKSENRPWVSWGAYDRRKFDEEAVWDRQRPPMCAHHLNLKLMYSVLSGGKPLGMDRAMKNLGLELLGRHHDGADDAHNTARILLHIIEGGR